LTSGQPLPRIPPLRGRIGVDIRYEGLSIKPELVMVGRQDKVFINETPTAGYATFNLLGTYTISRQHNAHIFTVNGFNLNDKLSTLIDQAGLKWNPVKLVHMCLAGFLLGYGGSFIDAKGKLLTDSAEAIEAGKMYQTLLAKSGPPGVAGFNWNESQTLFLQGKAAMWLDGIGFAQPLEDPTKSRIVGKVGYGVMPAGPKAQVSALFGDGEGISSFSKKKGPAWYYLQWASNKTNQTRMLQAAAGAPVRNSAYAAAQQSSDFKAPKEWVECMLKSAAIAQPGLPVIAPVTEFRDVFGIALTNMINGADPAAELRKATAEFQPVLDKSEKA